MPILGAGLAARQRRIENPDGLLGGIRGDFSRNERGRGGVIDKDSTWFARKGEDEPVESQIFQVPAYYGDGILINVDSVRIAEITDGTTHTLLVGEVTGGEPGSHLGVMWIAFPVAATASGINGAGTIPGEGEYYRHALSGYSSYHPGGCHFGLADGSALFLSQYIAPPVLAALTTRSHGETISADDY